MICRRRVTMTALAVLAWIPLARADAPAGETFLLAVGVESYDDGTISPLRFAVADTKAVADLFKKEGVPDANIAMLTSDATDAEERPTRTALLKALERIRLRARGADRIVIFFAGHGIEQDGVQYLLTWDTRLNLVEDTALPVTLISRALKGTQADRVLFIIDACRNSPRADRGGSDAKLDESFARGVRPRLTTGLTAREVKTALLLACDVGQRAWEWPEEKHGAFTYFLLEALSGKAADANGQIHVGAIGEYVRTEVSSWCERAQKPAQTPRIDLPDGTDFVLFGRAGQPFQPPVQPPTGQQPGQTQPPVKPPAQPTKPPAQPTKPPDQPGQPGTTTRIITRPLPGTNPPAQPTGPVTVDTLLGRWSGEIDGMPGTIEFDANGNFTLHMGDPDLVFTGTFKLKPGGKVTMILPTDDQPGELTVHRIDADTLDLIDEDGDTYHITRVGSAGPTGPGDIVVVRPGHTGSGAEPQRLRLERQREAREQAFTVLVPKGWKMDGGVSRLPAQTYGALNAVSANLDCTVHDPQGRAMYWCYPALVYCDASVTGTAAQFPVGTICNGAVSLAKMDPGSYLSTVLFPRLRPQAQNGTLVGQSDLPDRAAVQENIDQMMGMQGFTVTAAMHTVEYDEGGVHYRERLLAVVEDSGPAAMGIWRVVGAVGMRAPADDFERLSAVLGASWISLQWNPAWRDREMKLALKTAGLDLPADALEQFSQVDLQTAAEAAEEDFIALFDGETGYWTDPFGGDDDAETIGASAWPRRWQAANGEVIYSGAGYDPATDPAAKGAGFKACPPLEFN